MKRSKKLALLLVTVLSLSAAPSHAGGFNYRVVRVNLGNNNGYRVSDGYNNTRYNFSNLFNFRFNTPDVVETPEAPVEEPATPVEKPEEPKVPETPVEKPQVPVEEPTRPTYPPVKEEEDKVEQDYSGLSADEAEVVRLVNVERQKAGLKPVQASSKLADVARLKSKDMADKNYFSHTSPTYGSPFDMMRQFGINYRTAGENIAKGYLNPASVMNGWMNSQGHRENILNPSFGTLGVGAYKVGNTIYWTQMFTN